MNLVIVGTYSEANFLTPQVPSKHTPRILFTVTEI